MPDLPEGGSRRLSFHPGTLFTRHSFRGHVVTLLSGTTVAMALSFLVLPLLTRLYAPEDFGILNYFIAIISMLITVSSLHYDDAIPLPENDAEAANVAALAFVLTLSICLVCGVVALWREDVAALLGMPDIQPWLLLVAPTLFIMRLVKLGEAWFVRSKVFRVISGTQIANTVTMNGARILAGLPAATASPNGLIGGFLAGQTVSALVYLGAFGRKGIRSLRRSVSRRGMLAMAARYRRFSLFTTPSALLHAVITRLPFLLIPIYFTDSGESILGYLGQAMNVLAVPLSLVGGAVSQVLVVHAAEAHRAGTLQGVVERVHERLVMIGLFPTLLLMIAGPDLVAFALGAPWREAGVYLQLLAPWLFLASVAAPLTRVFDVLERQRTDLVTTGTMFAILLAALIAGGATGRLYVALGLLGVAGVTARALHIGVLLRLAGVSTRTSIRPYIRFALTGCPFLALVYLGTLAEWTWITVVSTIIAGAGYTLFVSWREHLFAPPPAHDGFDVGPA